MLAARLGAWLRNTGEKWAMTSFAEKLALLLALLAVIYTVVTGAAELRYQARAREALAQVKAARLAAGAVSASAFFSRSVKAGASRSFSHIGICHYFRPLSSSSSLSCDNAISLYTSQDCISSS